MEAVTGGPKPIRLVIPGAFWDSQIYSGELYLFGLSGELWTISWDKLVAGLPIPPQLRIAGDLALLGNHCLYENGARLLLSDPDISRLLLEKFRHLGALPPWEVNASAANIEDNPLPFPHSDSAVHYHTLYVGASDGLYELSRNDGTGSRGRIRLSDAPALHIAAGFSTMAQAAGADGLFATRLASEPPALRGRAETRGIHVSERSCMTCEWAHSSVISAGYDHSVYLAPFVRPPESDRGGSRSRQRQFDPIIPEHDIFKGDTLILRGFTWGAGDKIFRFNDGYVEVTQYRQRSRKPPTFTFRGGIPLDDPETVSSVVSARAASFGSVIEGDSALQVMLTTGGSLSLPGEPTNWRVFPRSQNYINHLHVIYEDRLEIFAFTHDYFVDQDAKLSGLDPRASDRTE